MSRPPRGTASGARRTAVGSGVGGTAPRGDEGGGEAGEVLLADVAAGQQRQREEQHRAGQQDVAVDADERQRGQGQREAGEAEEEMAIAPRHACCMVTGAERRRQPAAVGGRAAARNTRSAVGPGRGIPPAECEASTPAAAAAPLLERSSR